MAPKSLVAHKKRHEDDYIQGFSLFLHHPRFNCVASLKEKWRIRHHRECCISCTLLSVLRYKKQQLEELCVCVYIIDINKHLSYAAGCDQERTIKIKKRTTILIIRERKGGLRFRNQAWPFWTSGRAARCGPEMNDYGFFFSHPFSLFVWAASIVYATMMMMSFPNVFWWGIDPIHPHTTHWA